MNFKTIFYSLALLTILFSCNEQKQNDAKSQETPSELKNNYIIQPEFDVDKEVIENKIKQNYSAQEVRIGGIGIQSVAAEEKNDSNKNFWLKVVIVNAQDYAELKSKIEKQEFAKTIAQTSLKELKNLSKYDKIQITFVEKINSEEQEKDNFFFSIPNLEEIPIF